MDDEFMGGMNGREGFGLYNSWGWIVVYQFIYGDRLCAFEEVPKFYLSVFSVARQRLFLFCHGGVFSVGLGDLTCLLESRELGLALASPVLSVTQDWYLEIWNWVWWLKRGSILAYLVPEKLI